MNRHCRYWTFNDKQLQSVVSKFCRHYCICYCLYRSSGIDMRKIVCSFTSDTALNDVLVHALMCRIRKNKNAFQMYKRLFYCTHTHTHTTTTTTTTTTNVTIVRSVRRCASTNADDRCRQCTSAIHASLHRQQIRESVAFWTL